MPIRSGGHTRLLAPDLRQVIVETGKERPLEYPMVFNVTDMEWNPETDMQYAGLSTLLDMPEGTQFPLDEPVSGGTKTFTAAPFGLACEMTWIMWRDDLYGVMRELAAELARASRNKQEVSAWSVLNNAFSASYLGFDGDPLVSTSHLGLDGESRSNRSATDIEFSITGIQDAVERFESMENERGRPQVISPVMALVTPSFKWDAREILGSTGKPYTTDNELNALIEEDLSWMVAHYITTSTYWFLLAAKSVHSLSFRWRDEPIYDNFDDPWTKNSVWTVYQRHSEGFTTWRGVDGSTGA